MTQAVTWVFFGNDAAHGLHSRGPGGPLRRRHHAWCVTADVGGHRGGHRKAMEGGQMDEHERVAGEMLPPEGGYC